MVIAIIGEKLIKKPNIFGICIFFTLFSGVIVGSDIDIINFISGEKDIEKITNAINNLEWSAGNLQDLKSLWNKDLQAKPEGINSKLDNDLVRLSLANVLMQARRQCLVEIDMSELHDFVLTKTKSKNIQVRSRATYFLGLAGNDEDIPFLSSVVEAEKEGFAEEAALSLTFMHTHAALKQLEKLSKNVKRKSLKTFIDELLEKYEAIPIKENSIRCKE